MPCGLWPGKINGQDMQNLLLKKTNRTQNQFLCIVYTLKNIYN